MLSMSPTLQGIETKRYKSIQPHFHLSRCKYVDEKHHEVRKLKLKVKKKCARKRVTRRACVSEQIGAPCYVFTV